MIGGYVAIWLEDVMLVEFPIFFYPKHTLFGGISVILVSWKATKYELGVGRSFQHLTGPSEALSPSNPKISQRHKNYSTLTSGFSLVKRGPEKAESYGKLPVPFIWSPVG